MIAVRENGATSGAGVLGLYVYDNLGRRVSVTRGNGVVTTYAYDSASRLDVLGHNLSGTGSDVTLDFAHNAAGQILSRDRTSNNGSYVYPQPGMNLDAYASNGLNQIASLDGAGFTHDARGNLTSAGGVSYTYDAFNRLTAAGPLFSCAARRDNSHLRRIIITPRSQRTSRLALQRIGSEEERPLPESRPFSMRH